MSSMIRWSGRLALVLGLAALIAILLQGPGYRMGWWGLQTAFFKVFPAALLGGGLAVLLGLIGVFGGKLGGPRVRTFALIGLLAGATAAAVPLGIQRAAKAVPMIHDITTDTSRPPQFVAVSRLRADAPNPVSYDSATSEQQRQAYPDIKTLELAAGSDRAFSAAQEVVAQLGWELVDADPAAGRIEATDTTLWFGFKDDVVIRLTPKGEQTWVDIRSKSRVGKSDLGVNAERIREFRAALIVQLDR